MQQVFQCTSQMVQSVVMNRCTLHSPFQLYITLTACFKCLYEWRPMFVNSLVVHYSLQFAGSSLTAGGHFPTFTFCGQFIFSHITLLLLRLRLRIRLGFMHNFTEMSCCCYFQGRVNLFFIIARGRSQIFSPHSDGGSWHFISRQIHLLQGYPFIKNDWSLTYFYFEIICSFLNI